MLRVPLAAQITTPRAVATLVGSLTDLRFSNAAPGGYTACQVSLDRSIRWQPPEITDYARLRIFDTASGETVWEGRLEDPTPSVGSDGEVWELVGVGPAAHAHDQETPSIFITRDMTEAIPTPSSRTTASIGPAALPLNGGNGIKIHAPRGEVWVVGNHGSIGFFRIADAGQDLASFSYSWETGGNSINWKIRGLVFGDANPSGLLVTEDNMVAGTTWSIRAVIGSEFAAGGDTTLVLRLYRGVTDANPVPDDLAWVIFGNAVLRAVLFDVNGSPRESSSDYAEDYVTSDEVVADQIGRFLPDYDGASANITAGVAEIDHLAYPDGATPAVIFGDLMLLDPYYWAAWERDPSSGKHRFEWVPWPSEVRYEVSAHDGFEVQATAADLRNRVHVRWKDATGRIRRTSSTSTVDALTAAGLTRSETIDLGDELGSNANATAAATRYLNEHSTVSATGRLTVAGPVLDLRTGRMVPPWALRAGNLIRVRGIRPHPASIGATDRNGASVFRVVNVDFDASSASAALSLDQYPPTLAQQVADLHSGRLVGARRR
jgi:hypothetical protein